MAIRVGIPINLLTYKPQQQTTALCWQVNLEVPILLDALDFEVEVDVVDTFDSINKKVYTKDNVVNYQNGTFFKSFVLDDAVLIENAQTYYWRVRVYNSYAESYWSDVQKQETEKFLNSMEYNKEFNILNLSSDNPQYITIKKNLAGEYILNGAATAISEADLLTALTSYGITSSIYIYVGPQKYEVAKAFWYDDTELAERLLPDRYVYTKNGNTNIKRILEMYMRLIGVFKNEMVQVQNNYNYKKTQDKDLYDMLGVLLDYTSNTQEPMITYKYELLNLWQAYLHQGTIEAMNILFRALYGTEPTIDILKDIVDDKWTVYEQMKLLSIDGSTPSALTINRGDAFYNSGKNKVIIATANSDTGSWNNALEQEPNKMTTYQTQSKPPNTKGLCFTAVTANAKIYLLQEGNPTVGLSYSPDGSNWQKLEVSESTSTYNPNNHPIILENIGDKVYIKGNYSNQSENDYILFYFRDGQVAASGNLYSILDENNFENITDLSLYGPYLFFNLFHSNSDRDVLVDASNLELPATILSEHCYDRMFMSSTGLIKAPNLPATTLAAYCYEMMFAYCWALTTSPALVATTLAEGCYEYMFYNCPSLNKIYLYYTGNFNSSFAGWVYDVPNTGTFYYSGNDTNHFSDSAIPVGWTIGDLIVDNTFANTKTTGVIELLSYDILTNGFYQVELGGEDVGGEAAFKKELSAGDNLKFKTMSGAFGTSGDNEYIAGNGVGLWLNDECILAVGGGGNCSPVYGFGGGGYEGGLAGGTDGGNNGYSYDGTIGSYNGYSAPGDGDNATFYGHTHASGSGGSGYINPNYLSGLISMTAESHSGDGYFKLKALLLDSVLTNTFINDNAVQDNTDLELQNYYYDGVSFILGIPDVKRYYVRRIDLNEQGKWPEDEVKEHSEDTPFLYTNQYLASNLVLTVYNYYGIDVDQKILKQIVNNLKPLNVNITIIIINQANGYSYGLIDKYGNPVNYWGQRVIH